MKDIFEQSVPRAGEPTDAAPSADVAFISGGLKAAFHTKNSVRKTILNDVSQALNCESEDLEFLFADEECSEPDNNIFDFPDSERRRQVIKDNRLDAAE